MPSRGKERQNTPAKKESQLDKRTKIQKDLMREKERKAKMGNGSSDTKEGESAIREHANSEHY